MKKLLIFFVCIPFLSFSQWKFKETNDPFDGKTKAVIATGYGGDYPYKYPSLIIVKEKFILQMLEVQSVLIHI